VLTYEIISILVNSLTFIIFISFQDTELTPYDHMIVNTFSTRRNGLKSHQPDFPFGFSDIGHNRMPYVIIYKNWLITQSSILLSFDYRKGILESDWSIFPDYGNTAELRIIKGIENRNREQRIKISTYQKLYSIVHNGGRIN